MVSFQRNANVQGFGPAYQYQEGTVFYLNKPLFEVDLASFEVLSGGYAVDADTVFYDGRVVIGIDRNSFEVLGYKIAKNKQGMGETALWDLMAKPLKL